MLICLWASGPPYVVNHGRLRVEGSRAPRATSLGSGHSGCRALALRSTPPPVKFL